MKKTRYTKSRFHEKLNKFVITCCSVLMVSVVCTTVLIATHSSENDIVVKAEAPTVTTHSQSYDCECIYGVENEIDYQILTREARIIRCTVYCDTGYTASGAWTTEGCLAGMKEWLGRQCKLYRVNKDGSQGECIGTFTFKDTGFGLDELDGVKYETGTIMNGASIDMWHPTEEECWALVAKYGDYVYMEFID